MIEKLPGFGLSRTEKDKMAERMQAAVDITYEHAKMANHPITGEAERPEDLQRELELIRRNPALYVITALHHVSHSMNQYGINASQVNFSPPESRHSLGHETSSPQHDNFRG